MKEKYSVLLVCAVAFWLSIAGGYAVKAQDVTVEPSQESFVTNTPSLEITDVVVLTDVPAPTEAATEIDVVPPVEPTLEPTPIATPTPAPEQPPVVVVPVQKWYETEEFWMFALALISVIAVGAFKDKTIHNLVVHILATANSILYEGGKTIVDKGLDALEDKANLTTDTDDNAQVDRFREMFKELFAEADAARSGQINQQVQLAVTKAMADHYQSVVG